MKTQIFPLIMVLALALGVYSCKKDKTAEVTKGDLQVVVEYQTLPQLPNGAEVYSDPPGISGFTDATGTLLVRGVPTGTYQVYSYKTGYGGGKSAASVMTGQLGAAVIILIPGYDPGVAPVIDEISPQDSSSFSPSDSISFRIKVHNSNIAPATLSVKAESNIDGVLFQGHPDNSGVVTFKKKLSKNSHVVTFTVTNSSQFSAHASLRVFVSLPEKIHLNTPVVANGTILLNWTQYTGSDFGHYEVYRLTDLLTPELLASIPAATTTTFTDTRPPLVDSTAYFVTVVNQNGLAAPSNTQGVKSPSGFILGFVIHGVCIDAAEHCIYFHDLNSVTKFNYLTNTILDHWIFPFGFVSFDSRVKMSLADNGKGKELYLSSNQHWCIYVLNPSDMSLKTTISFPQGIVDYSTNGDGFIYLVPNWDESSQTAKIVSYNRSTGKIADSIHFNFMSSVFSVHCIPGKNEVAALSSNEFHHIYHDSQGHFSNIVSRPNSQFLMDWQLIPYCFAPGGGFFITGINGMVCTTDNALTYKNSLPTQDIFYDFCILPNNSDLYATSMSQQQVRKFNYPSLAGNGMISTKGYPAFVVTDGTSLVVLSQTDMGASYDFLVEIYPL